MVFHLRPYNATALRNTRLHSPPSSTTTHFRSPSGAIRNRNRPSQTWREQRCPRHIHTTPWLRASTPNGPHQPHALSPQGLLLSERPVYPRASRALHQRTTGPGDQNPVLCARSPSPRELCNVLAGMRCIGHTPFLARKAPLQGRAVTVKRSIKRSGSGSY